MAEPGDLSDTTDGEAETRASIGDLLGRLVADITAFVQAELALYRAQAGQKAVAAGWSLGLFIVAIALVQGATIALLVGLVLALAPHLGIAWAIAIVVFGSVALAAVLAKIGSVRLSKLMKGGSGS